MSAILQLYYTVIVLFTSKGFIYNPAFIASISHDGMAKRRMIDNEKS